MSASIDCASAQANHLPNPVPDEVKEERLARLNALPYATYCIACQREAERQGGSASSDVDWGRLLDSSGGDADLSINDIELDVS